MRHVASCLVVVSLAACIAACGAREGRHIGALNGRVVSAATAQPIAGARVLITWDAEVSAVFHSQRAPIRACQTRSATDGSYSVAAWRAPAGVTSTSPVSAKAIAFVEGYRMLPGDPIEHAGSEPLVLYLSGTPGGSGSTGAPALTNVADCAHGPG